MERMSTVRLYLVVDGTAQLHTLARAVHCMHKICTRSIKHPSTDGGEADEVLPRDEYLLTIDGC